MVSGFELQARFVSIFIPNVSSSMKIDQHRMVLVFLGAASQICLHSPPLSGEGNYCVAAVGTRGAASQICLHFHPRGDENYGVAAIELAASNSPPDCCI